jgi:hypothetical protein
VSQLRYAGYIAIPIEINPRPQDTHGCIGIDNLHCTMLLPKQLKAVKETHEQTYQETMSNKDMKAYVKEVIANHPDPPMLVLGSESHLALRDIFVDDKHTYFLVVTNQEEMQTYLDTLTDALGIPNVERFFHVSIANDTGKPQDSIGDINADDLEVSK